MKTRRPAIAARHKLVPGSFLRKRKKDGWPFHRYVDQLDHWLFEKNLSYTDTLAELAKILPKNRRPPKVRALSNWYHVRNREKWLEKFIDKAKNADEYAKVAAANPGPITESLERLIQVAAFESAEAPVLDLDQLRTLTLLLTRFKELHIREQELSLTERKVALLEKKAEQADRTRDVLTDGTLTPEQREARIREVLGLPPAPARAKG